MFDQAPELLEAINALRAGRDVERHFETVFRSCYGNVRRYFEKRGIDSQTSSDLAQDVLIVAFKGIHELRDPVAFSGWIFGTARNKLLRHLENKRKSPRQFDDTTPAVADETPSGEHQAIDIEVRTKLRETLEELPPQMRACVKLSIVEELPYQEIAGRLGITESTVKVQIHRARKELAKRLGPLFHVCLWMI
jgi:RNA polymerase sigma factor (sigma-70 family)